MITWLWLAYHMHPCSKAITWTALMLELLLSNAVSGGF